MSQTGPLSSPVAGIRRPRAPGASTTVPSVFRVAWYRAGATFRSRWTGYFSLVLLIGLLGGLAMGSVAAARRTQSSFPTYLASTNPSDVTVASGYDIPPLGLTSGYNPKLIERIYHLTGVERAATYENFDGNVAWVTGLHYDLSSAQTVPRLIGSTDGEFATQDRVTVVAGRMASPHRWDEAVMNAQAASGLGLHIGSVVRLGLYSDAQEKSGYHGKAYRAVQIRLVGIVVFSGSLVQDDFSALSSGQVLLTPALTRELAPCCAYLSFSALRLGGANDVAKVADEASQLIPHGNAVGAEYVTSVTEAKAERAIEPESMALGVFGGIVALAALLIAGQVIGRQLRLGADELGTLRALGAGPAMTWADGLIGIVGAVVVGSVLAVGVAVALSPLAPLGVVRPVYPARGIAFDWTVLGGGLALLVLGLSAVAAALAYRAQPHRVAFSQRLSRQGASRLAWTAATSGLPLPAAIGFRFAVEPGAGRGATAVRSAIVGAVLAMVVLMATVIFGASLNGLVSHPPLYGWNWNFAMLGGFSGDEDLPAHQTAALLDKDRYVEAWSGANFVSAKLDGQSVPVLTETPGALVAPPLLSGHGLDRSGQIVLGATTLTQLHKRVGQTVVLSNGFTKPRPLLIVGTATMPSIGAGETGTLEMGSGALVATSDFPTPDLNSQASRIPGPNAILIRTRPGASTAAAFHSLEKVNAAINAVPADPGQAGGVVSVLRPAEIVNYRTMGDTPVYLGLGLATGAVIALGLTLVASVRRHRRDLAVLKMLGFTRRQLATAVAWQSSTAVGIGTIVGIPLGTFLGRSLWDVFAHQIDVVPAPSVPALSILLIAAGALVLANFVAALPGQMAARCPTAVLLRAE